MLASASKGDSRALLLTLLVASSAVAQERSGPAAVELRLELGERLDYSFTYDSSVLARLGKTEVEGGVRYEQRLSVLRVTPDPEDAASDSDLVVELGFGRVRGVSRIPLFGSVEFDSDDADAEYPSLAAVTILPVVEPVGKSIRVVLSPSGRVRSVRGWARIFEGTNAGKALANQETAMTDAWFLENAQSLFVLLPERQVDTGEPWRMPYRRSMFGKGIEFDARCSTAKPAAGTFAYAMGSASPGPAEASAQRGWVTDATEILDASLLGTCEVSTADGFATRQTIDFVARVNTPGPLGGAMESTAEERLSLVRLAPEGE